MFFKKQMSYAKMYSVFSKKIFQNGFMNNIIIQNTIPKILVKKLFSSGCGSEKSPFLARKKPFSKEENEEFMAYIPEFIETLTSVKPWSEVPKFKEKLNKVLDYNLVSGIHTRGVATVLAYRALEKSEHISQQNIKMAVMLGWCVTLMESSVVCMDDIVDNSSTRHGKPCWFRNESIGLKAVMDGVYLENSIYFILKKYFSTHPQYLNLLEFFTDINFKIALGQSLDLLPRELNEFTFDYFNLLAIGKAEYSLFYGPVVAAMLLADITDERLFRQAKPLLLSMGNYYQIQNDFLDCYGNPDDTGKVGTDIREGKCSWLVVKALQKANKSQRNLLQEHYGKDSKESIPAIRHLYDEMNMVNEYKICEEQTYQELRWKISQLSKDLPHDLFYLLLDQLYDRKWGA